MEFEFATASRILFGPGKLRELGPIVRTYGSRALVVAGRSSQRVGGIVDVLTPDHISSIPFHLNGEPTVIDVQRGAELAKKERIDFVVGIGGGSALDAAKAIAALVANPGDLFDYLEVVGRGKPLVRPSVPCIAIPTTAGTGTEVTRNAVLASPEHRFKVSLRSPFMLPRLAVIDPQLTLDLPPHLTAVTGLDALTQLIEPYVSHRANPLTDGFCVEGLRRVSRSLRKAFQQGRDLQAREDMALASFLSGLALANAALGAVHGFAAPLGGMYSAPHGGLCAAALPHAMSVNIQALRQRQPDGPALRRYAHAAQLLTGNPTASPEDGIAWVRELCTALQIRPLREHGVREEDFAQIVEKASKASSMKGNPLPLTPAEMRRILELSF